MLVKAVEDGTGTNAIVPHFTIAGKTSTAQRPDGNGTYSGYVSGFVGFHLNVQRKFIVFMFMWIILKRDITGMQLPPRYSKDC